jgi:hypothetical protein
VSKPVKALCGVIFGLLAAVVGIVLVFELAVLAGGVLIVGGVAMSAAFLLLYDVDDARREVGR